jgi:hypothetical protein
MKHSEKMRPSEASALFAVGLCFLPAVPTMAAKPKATKPPEAAAPLAAVSPNLVSRWPGEGNANDVVSGHNGILENGLGFAPGRFGKAFSFNGHQYVSIPFNAAFDFSPGDRFTVSAWVQPKAVGSYQAILVKAPPGGPWEWGIIIDPQNHFYTGRDAHDVAQSTTTIQKGKWYHVAVTYQSGALMMYVNGVLENQATGVSVGQSLGGLALGHKGDTELPKEDPDWFTGLIDEVRLYNRALTAPEIALLAHGQEVP